MSENDTFCCPCDLYYVGGDKTKVRASWEAHPYTVSSCTSRPARESVRRDEPPVRERAPHEPGDDIPHLVEGVGLADVVLPGELLDVAVQVLRAHLVERPGVRRLSMDQKDSIPLVCAIPRTYSATECLTAAWSKGIPS